MPPRKKYKPCDQCGGLMEKGGAGYVCTSCPNVEWFTEETTTLSSVVKCPNCGHDSPNTRFCNYCGYTIDEKMRRLVGLEHKL